MQGKLEHLVRGGLPSAIRSGGFHDVDAILIDVDDWDEAPTEPFERLSRVVRSNETSGEIELRAIVAELDAGEEVPS